MLDPYLLLPVYPVPFLEITACAWTSDSDDSFSFLISWASRWSGPISLVMTTAVSRGSIQHEQLIQRLKSLRSHPSLNSLSLHLVHVTNNQYSPSTYLNLARFFASSRAVMLFPADLSNFLPSKFHSNLLSRIHHPVRKPLLIASAATSVFSIPDLTPVILPRNYQMWCSERAFLASRTSDWNDCIWQLWLEEYGLGQANLTVPIDNELDASADITGLVRYLLCGEICC
ncbi:hypothetical protein GGX14DRAFT_357494 [Mycena pura]|uniref:Uncharacterized protein n=1 Tax=Mycena pura TaxID=153505 RepID=A0AAD6VVF8_9AGAR|nr:hypothetical protein GGX14DRAFT_357494 [Mycena pura]